MSGVVINNSHSKLSDQVSWNSLPTAGQELRGKRSGVNNDTGEAGDYGYIGVSFPKDDPGFDLVWRDADLSTTLSHFVFMWKETIW